MIVHKLLPLVALGLNLLLLGSALAPDRRSLRNVRFAYLATALAVWNLGVFGPRARSGGGVGATKPGRAAGRGWGWSPAAGRSSKTASGAGASALAGGEDGATPSREGAVY